jgi:hypothetical protein
MPSVAKPLKQVHVNGVCGVDVGVAHPARHLANVDSLSSTGARLEVPGVCQLFDDGDVGTTPTPSALGEVL